ncbi:unnamed protein product, partial [Pylaiella littoralis]
ETWWGSRSYNHQEAFLRELPFVMNYESGICAAFQNPSFTLLYSEFVWRLEKDKRRCASMLFGIWKAQWRIDAAKAEPTVEAAISLANNFAASDCITAHALVMAGTSWHGGGRGQPWYGRGAGRSSQLEHRETVRWCDLHKFDTHSNSECNLQQAVQRRHMGFGRGGRGAAAPGQSQPRRHSSQDGRAGNSWTEAHGQQYHTGHGDGNWSSA